MPSADVQLQTRPGQTRGSRHGVFDGQGMLGPSSRRQSTGGGRDEGGGRARELDLEPGPEALEVGGGSARYPLGAVSA